MTIKTVNNANFQTEYNTFVGVMVRYQSVTRKEVTDPLTLEKSVLTETHNSAIVFSGEPFDCIEKLDEDAIFHAWRNIVNVYWETFAKQKELSLVNNGIRTKLKTATPHSIVFTDKKRDHVVTLDVASTVWSKIGLIPTKKDLEDAETSAPRDWKRNINAIAKASMDALNFRPQIIEELKKVNHPHPKNAHKLNNPLKDAQANKTAKSHTTRSRKTA